MKDELLKELINIQNKTFFLLREMSFQQYKGLLERPEYFKELGARLCTVTRKLKEAKKPTIKRKVVKNKK